MVRAESQGVPARIARELPLRPQPVEVVAIGASAGGVEALTRLVALLPGDLRAAVFVVLHVMEGATSVLPRILSRAGSLTAANAREGEPVEAGRVYVAPPGSHLTLEGAVVRVGRGPRENGHRPAVDPLFRGAAESFGPRAAAVVLSGTRDDGTAGLQKIKRLGGVTLVQDPAEALYDGMPRNAIAHVAVDGVLTCDELAAAIVRLIGEAPISAGAAGGVAADPTRLHPLPAASAQAGAASSERLFAGPSDQLEVALWAAIRSLEDRAVLLRGMARRARDQRRPNSAGSFETRAREAGERAATIRTALEQRTALSQSAIGDVANESPT
jgi:two-component system chemotaxis response regulator CheB